MSLIKSKHVIIETLATGDEILSGDVLDKNSSFLSKNLQKSGVCLSRINSVGDDSDAILKALQEISQRANVCVCSGGLGPTLDDLTVDVVCKLLGVEEAIHEPSHEQYLQKIKLQNRKPNPHSIRSVRFPKDSEVFLNPVGVAPGFLIFFQECYFFFFPGVPSEYQAFIKVYFLPWYLKRFGQSGFVLKEYRTLNWPESELAYRFEDYPNLFPKVGLGFRAHGEEVSVKLWANLDQTEKSLSCLEPAVKLLLSRIGPWIVSEGEQSLSEVVHELLLQRNKVADFKLCVAESFTGGMLAQSLISHAGASTYFKAGWVSYSELSKVHHLGINPDTLAQYGVYSSQIAIEMAIGALKKSDSDLAISTTGEASSKEGISTVYLGLATKSGATFAIKKTLKGNRNQIQSGAVLHALDLIRRTLKGDPLEVDR